MTWGEKVEYNKLVAKASVIELNSIAKERLAELSLLHTEENRPLFHWDIKALKKLRNGKTT
jgi:hypothetical protein